MSAPSAAQAPPAEHLRDDLLEAFWERGLVLFGERVKQEYALNTPVFIDLRHKLYDDLDTLAALGAALYRRIMEIGEAAATQQVIGIPDTATPMALAAALASREGAKPLLYGQMRKKPASYPGGRSGSSSYMGVADPSREITVVDDVMASGRTKLWCIERLKEEDLKVSRILVVVNREQGGDKILERQGVPVHSLYRISDLVRYYEATGRIDSATAQTALDHLRSRRFS